MSALLRTQPFWGYCSFPRELQMSRISKSNSNPNIRFTLAAGTCLNSAGHTSDRIQCTCFARCTPLTRRNMSCLHYGNIMSCLTDVKYSRAMEDGDLKGTLHNSCLQMSTECNSSPNRSLTITSLHNLYDQQTGKGSSTRQCSWNFPLKHFKFEHV
jgi:hypothetical protein